MAVFQKTNTNTIVAGAAGLTRALPTGGLKLNASFYNAGPLEAWVCTGPAALVPTLPVLATNVGAEGNTTCIPVGVPINFQLSPNDTFWGAITRVAGVANVEVTCGEGA